MKRRLENELKKWKESTRRKPLLILGARQVGKTWLMNEFGKSHYARVAYLRFDRNERVRTIFENSNYDMQELLLLMQAEIKAKITPSDTLIILDEIQECPAALTSLKYFCEDLPDYHVMAAGSLLGGTAAPRYRVPGW